jgi:uncharacterized membrane protein
MKTQQIKKPLWFTMVALAIFIGIYPALYFTAERFGILQSKSTELLSNPFWYGAFYLHIILGGLALLIGWTQFSSKIRNKNIGLHRNIGKVYVIAVLVSAIAGFYIAFFAMGGIIASLGFICLSLIWFYTTLIAYTSIRKGQLIKHQNMMIYSYATCFAAVTLRLWLPALTVIFGDFKTAYLIIAWWCWIPNLAVAYLFTKRTQQDLIK